LSEASSSAERDARSLSISASSLAHPYHQRHALRLDQLRPLKRMLFHP